MAPELDVAGDFRGAGLTFTAGRLDEALVAEDVIEVPVAVDHPPDRPAEVGQLAEQLVGLTKVGPGVEHQQGVAARARPRC